MDDIMTSFTYEDLYRCKAIVESLLMNAMHEVYDADTPNDRREMAVAIMESLDSAYRPIRDAVNAYERNKTK